MMIRQPALLLAVWLAASLAQCSLASESLAAESGPMSAATEPNSGPGVASNGLPLEEPFLAALKKIAGDRIAAKNADSLLDQRDLQDFSTHLSTVSR